MSDRSFFVDGGAEKVTSVDIQPLSTIHFTSSNSQSSKKPAAKTVANKTTTRAPQSQKGDSTNPRSNSPSGRWWAMTVLAILISAYAGFFIFGTPPGDPKVKARIMSTWSGRFHVFGGLVSVGTGPFQFLRGVRRRRPAVHRWVGRGYVAAIAAGGIGGVNVALDAMSYPIGDYGFLVLALLWLATVWMGVQKIWYGDVAQHRDWMTRNFALTYAAVMLRWQLPLLIFFGNSHEMALTITAFTCWIPNLIFAEWWIHRSPKASLHNSYSGA